MNNSVSTKSSVSMRSLPVEIQEQIFYTLTSSRVYPFLFDRLTHKAARETPWRHTNITDVQPRSTSFAKLYRRLTIDPRSAILALKRTRSLRLSIQGLVGACHIRLVEAMHTLHSLELLLRGDELDGSGALLLPASVRHVTTNALKLLWWVHDEDVGLEHLTIVENSRVTASAAARRRWLPRARPLRWFRHPREGKDDHAIWQKVKHLRVQADQPEHVRNGIPHYVNDWGDRVVRKFCETMLEVQRFVTEPSLETIELTPPGLISNFDVGDGVAVRNSQNTLLDRAMGYVAQIKTLQKVRLPFEVISSSLTNTPWSGNMMVEVPFRYSNLADDHVLQAANSLLDMKVLWFLFPSLDLPNIQLVFLHDDGRLPLATYKPWRHHTKDMEQLLRAKLKHTGLDLVKEILETAPQSLRMGMRILEDVPLFESTYAIERWIRDEEHPQTIDEMRKAKRAQGDVDHVESTLTSHPLSELFESALQM